MAAILAGARGEAEETCPPHHISPFGCPAAQISYLKPKQICGGQRRGQACDIGQLSLLTIPIKQMLAAQAREGGWERGWGPDSLLDPSRRVSGTGLPWAEMSPRPPAASHGLSGLRESTALLGPCEDISRARPPCSLGRGRNGHRSDGARKPGQERHSPGTGGWLCVSCGGCRAPSNGARRGPRGQTDWARARGVPRRPPARGAAAPRTVLGTP